MLLIRRDHRDHIAHNLYPFITLSVAAILTAAASLKAYQLLNDPTASGLGLPTPLEKAGVLYEYAVATWLVSRCAPHLCQRITVATFSCFLAVATVKAVTGKSSCGCFGGIDVAPWATALFDLVVLTTLHFTKPEANGPPPVRPTRFKWFDRMLCCGTLALGLGVLGVFVRARHEPLPAMHLSSSVSAINLGTVTPGQTADAVLTLSNLSDGPIEVLEPDVTCPCLSVTVPKQTLQGRENLSIGLHFDPAHEPDFRGPLQIGVVFRIKDHKQTLRTTVDVTVTRKP